MNYKNKLFIVLGLLGLACQSSYAYLKSVHVWRVPKKNGGCVKVIVLGDFHDAQQGMQANWDRNHKKNLVNALNSWKDQKIVFLLESNEGEYNSCERRLQIIKERYPAKLYVPLIQELRRFAYNNKHQLGKIEIKDVDLRTDAIRYMLDYAVEVNYGPSADSDEVKEFDLINQPITVNKLIKELDMQLQYLKKYKEKCEKDSVLRKTIQGYLPDLEKAQVSITQYAHEVLGDQLEDPIKNIFIRASQEDKRKWREIDNAMKASGKSESECEAVFKDYKNCIQKRAEKVNFAINQFFWQLPDAGFLVALDEHLNEAEKIVYFLGHGHAVELNQYLEKIGATLIKYAGVRIKESLKPVNDKELEVLLKNAFNDESSFDEILCNIEFCYNCKKTVEQMKRCGKCKTAKYCSAECQKKDWPKHKLECKK